MRKHIITFFTLVLTIALPITSFAQAEKVRILVGFAAGDSLDILTRILVEEVNKNSDFHVTVENLPGGGGVTATDAVAKSTFSKIPTIGAVVTNAFLALPLKNKVPYNPFQDLSPLLIFGQASPILVAPPDSQIKSFADLTQYAEKDPNTLKIALPSLGIPSHIALELIAKKDNLKWKYIPFAGAGEVELALMGKHADVGATGSLARIVDGQFTPLAIFGGERLKALPSTPTVLELGYSNAGLNNTYFLLFAPQGLNPQMQKNLESALLKAAESKQYQESLTKFSVAPVIFSSNDAKEFLKKAFEEEQALYSTATKK